MKCVKCRTDITWYNSYGHEGACICEKCFSKIVKQSNNDPMKALVKIFNLYK